MTGIGASRQALSKKLMANPYMFQATVRPISVDATFRFLICIASSSSTRANHFSITSLRTPKSFFRSHLCRDRGQHGD